MPLPGRKPPETPAPTEEQVQEAVENREMTAFERRVAMRAINLLDLGFSLEQVVRMKPQQQHFDWHEPERMLKAGQTHEQITFRLEPE